MGIQLSHWNGIRMTEPEKENPEWEVTLSTSATKMEKKMPVKIRDLLVALIGDIEEIGPIQNDWPNYSKLEKTKRVPENSFHCHLKKGRPTYVACWQKSKIEKKIEVFYVGTHENAPYKK